ncbi:hypothetical protein [Geobacter sp. SVR]|uniref:hypothetical protein n=1 Tax=Geobacter sp. SVR TaxID=2495594 RepID=UPI00143EF704|nr:hypothetical protein [Geobacter sp. SVR]BCS54515.1 hypothetical protein GSVR_28230 [Geobacter sp. SVR]GCF87115.1 hypothetical protein GSbR_37150 [Geobacter sp. SVR]
MPASLLAEVSVNVNVGVPAPRVVVQGPPAVLFQAPPLFLAPPQLGFYVGVDMPYDLMFASNFYYLHYGNAWYRSSYYNGPWVVVQRNYLPPIILRNRLEVIRSHRDREYRVYYRDRDRYQSYYRSRQYRPELREVRQEVRRDDHRRNEVREERRYEREDRRDDRHDDHGRGHDRRRGD